MEEQNKPSESPKPEQQKPSSENEAPKPPKQPNVDALLGLVEYKNDHQSHISLKDSDPDTSPCANKCVDKPCLTVCPAKVYVWEEEQKKIIVNYENCIECGAARVLCPYDNIKFFWPRGGFGVKYKMG